MEELVPNKPPKLNKYEDLITYVPDRPGHDFRYAMDSRKIETELNWKPKESFETGLRKTIKWYLSNTEWLKTLS